MFTHSFFQCNTHHTDTRNPCNPNHKWLLFFLKRRKEIKRTYCFILNQRTHAFKWEIELNLVWPCTGTSWFVLWSLTNKSKGKKTKQQKQNNHQNENQKSSESERPGSPRNLTLVSQVPQRVKKKKCHDTRQENPSQWWSRFIHCLQNKEPRPLSSWH